MISRLVSTSIVVIVVVALASCEGASTLASVPPVLEVRRGDASPGAGFVFAGSEDVLLLIVDATLDDSTKTSVSSIDVGITGARGVVASLKLVDDNDLAFGPALLDEEGVAHFDDLGLAFDPSQSHSFKVVADIADDAAQAAAFVASFAGAEGSAKGAVKMGVIGAAAGSPLEVRSAAALALTAAATNPLAHTVLVGDDALALTVDAAAGADVAVRISELAFTLAGDAAFDQAIGGATLFLDENQDGDIDVGIDDVLAVVSAPGFGDDTLTFTGLNIVVQPTTTAHFALVLELAPGGQSGTSVQAAIDTTGQITAVDAVTGNAATVSGAPVNGGTITIDDGSGGLAVALGDASPPPTSFPSGALGVTLLQVQLAASALEPIVVSELRVNHAGTGEGNDVVRVRLFLDGDHDGTLSQGDVQLAQSAIFLGGEAVFTLRTGADPEMPIDAGGAVDVIVVYDFGPLGTGSTFTTSIAVAGVHGDGVRSGGALLSIGSAEGGAFTSVGFGSLSASLGAQSPGAANESAAAARVLMTQVSFRAGDNEDVLVDAVTVRAAGSLNDAAGVTRAQLFVDLDEDGTIDAGDDVIGGDQAFDVDNGTVTFGGLDLRVPAGQRRSVLVSYDLSAAGLPGQSFSASITSPDAIVAHGGGSGVPLSPSGVVAGALKTVQFSGSLAVAAGASSPGGGNESAAGRVEMLQLSLTAGSVEDVALEGLVVRTNGTADDLVDVALVRLFRDVDDNGRAAGGDVDLGTARFDADNGTAAFTFDSETISAGTRVTYVVVYELAGSALPGQTFQALIANAGAVSGRGLLSAADITATGSATGSVKTVQGLGTLAISVGANTPGATAEASSATGISMLQLNLTASTVEDIDVSALVIRAAGTADDAALVDGVALFDDADADGNLDPDADPLALATGFNSDNGTATLTGFAVRIGRGETRSLLVTWDLAGGGQPGQTFQSAVVGAGVTAAGVASGGIVAVSGAANGSVKQIQGAGAMTVVLGANTPGSSVIAANAANLELFQFTVTTNGIESIAGDEVDVRAGGSVDDASAVTTVELFTDADRNGHVGVGDVLVGSVAGFAEDNGVAVFRNLGVLPAASQTSFLVRYQLSGDGAPGQTLNAALAALSFTGRGVSSNAPIVAGGSATGAAKTIQNRGSLTLAAGVHTPGAAIVSASTLGASVLQFQLTASAVEDVVFDGIVLRAGGTADDAGDVDAVRIFEDVDGDGTVSAPDVQLGSDEVYGSDNGTVTFGGINDVIAATATVNYIVEYDLTGTAAGNETLNAVLGGLAVGAHGVSSNSPVTTSGTATSASLTVRLNPLVVKVGTQNPAPQSVHPTDGSVVVAQVTVSVAGGEDVVVNSFSVTGAGTGNDVTGVAGINLIRDVDGDGEISGGDVALGGTLTFSALHGPAQFTGLGERITGPSEVSYLVVYDLSGAALPGQTFQGRTANAAALDAVDARTLVPVVSGGVAVNGGLLTIVGETNFWTTLPAFGAPASRTDHSAVAVGSKMFIFGGADANGARADGGVFNAGTNTWATLPVAGAPPSARSSHHVAAVGPRMVVWGGLNSAQTALGDGAVLNTDTGTWTATTATGAPSARAFAAVTATTDRVFVFGGATSDGTALGDGALYIPDDPDPAVANTWVALPAGGAPSARFNAAVSFLPTVGGAKGSVFVAGGFNGTAFLSDAFLFNLTTNLWSAAAAAPAVFSSAPSAVIGTRVVVEGGQGALGPEAEAFMYSAASNTWRTLPTTGAPGARTRHVGVAINGRAIFQGGFNGTTFLGGGGRYAVANDLWSPIATAGAPPARSGHSAVVIGGKMIVWGGLADNAFLNNGSSYTP